MAAATVGKSLLPVRLTLNVWVTVAVPSLAETVKLSDWSLVMALTALLLGTYT